MIFAVQFTQWLPIINKKLKINELKNRCMLKVTVTTNVALPSSACQTDLCKHDCMAKQTPVIEQLVRTVAIS